MRIALFITVLMVTMPAFAQEETTVTVLCENLPDYIAPEGVNFVPGQDDVVPADVGGGVEQPLSDPVRIPVQIELEEFFDLNDFTHVQGLDLEPTVSMLEIYQDGRVLYNGQDVSKQVLVACEREQASDGQAVDNAVNSEPDVQEIKEGIEGAPIDEPPSETLIEGQYP